MNIHKRGTKDTRGTVKPINRKQTDNAMAKNEKKTNRPTTAHTTQHRTPKNKQHKPQKLKTYKSILLLKLTVHKRSMLLA